MVGPHTPPSEDVWRRVRPLAEALLALPEGERAAALAGTPLPPAELELLAALLDEAERDPVDRFESALRPSSLPDTRGAGPARRVGPWTLLAVLGRGGMGEVWLARRGAGPAGQLAALKLLRTEESDARALAGLAERLCAERDVLARLEHPGIARLIDAGVGVDDQPYLVTEFVDGTPLDVWCAARDLGLRERVALLSDVARAVEAAHAVLVVHRDLKPSNVLVDTTGRVRLIDFGVAKALDPDRRRGAAVTQDFARYLTPRYASPEQLTGGAVTPASDVHALGVLAYELLVGAHPFDAGAGSAAEVVRAIVHDEAERIAGRAALGATPRRVDTDLDAVLAMCLRKDPLRRYPSAGPFAEDLRRWIAREPVRARRGTRRYRAAVFLRRHRALVALTAGVIVALGTGLAVVAAQRAELVRQREASDALLGDLRRATEVTLTRDAAELALVPAARPTLRRMLGAVARLAERHDDPVLYLDAVLGEARLAVSQWKPYEGPSADPRAALEGASRAAELGRAGLARFARHESARPIAAEALATEAEVLEWLGRPHDVLARCDEAEAALFGARSGAEALSASHGPQLLDAWARLRGARAEALSDLGRPTEAAAVLGALDAELGALAPAELFAQRLVESHRGRVAHALGALESAYGRDGRAAFEVAHQRGAAAVAGHPELPGRFAPEVLVAGLPRGEGGAPEAVEAALREAQALLAAREPALVSVSVRGELAHEVVLLRGRAGELLSRLGRHAEACASFDAAILLLEGQFAGRGPEWIESLLWAELRVAAGWVALAAGDGGAAAGHFAAAAEGSERQLARVPASYRDLATLVEAGVGLACSAPPGPFRDELGARVRAHVARAVGFDAEAKADLARRLARLDLALEGESAVPSGGGR